MRNPHSSQHHAQQWLSALAAGRPMLSNLTEQSLLPSECVALDSARKTTAYGLLVLGEDSGALANINMADNALLVFHGMDKLPSLFASDYPHTVRVTQEDTMGSVFSPDFCVGANHQMTLKNSNTARATTWLLAAKHAADLPLFPMHDGYFDGHSLDAVEASIHESTEKITQLTSDKLTLEQALKDAQNQPKDTLSTVVDLVPELAKKQQTIDKLDSEINILKAAANTASYADKTAKEEIAQLKKNKTELEKKLKDAEFTTQQKQNTPSKPEQDKPGKNLQKEITELKSRLQTEQSASEHLKNDIAALQASKIQLEAQLAKATAKKSFWQRLFG